MLLYVFLSHFTSLIVCEILFVCIYLVIHAVYHVALFHVILSKPVRVNCMCMFVSGWDNVATSYWGKLARLQMVLCGSVNQIPH